MVSDLTPFDENVIDYEVRIEKLTAVNNSLQKKVPFFFSADDQGVQGCQ